MSKYFETEKSDVTRIFISKLMEDLRRENVLTRDGLPIAAKILKSGYGINNSFTGFGDDYCEIGIEYGRIKNVRITYVDNNFGLLSAILSDAEWATLKRYLNRKCKEVYTEARMKRTEEIVKAEKAAFVAAVAKAVDKALEEKESRYKGCCE